MMLCNILILNNLSIDHWQLWNAFQKEESRGERGSQNYHCRADDTWFYITRLSPRCANWGKWCLLAFMLEFLYRSYLNTKVSIAMAFQFTDDESWKMVSHVLFLLLMLWNTLEDEHCNIIDFPLIMLTRE